jgi:hypothetical protein
MVYIVEGGVQVMVVTSMIEDDISDIIINCVLKRNVMKNNRNRRN